MSLAALILPSLIPALADGLRGLFGRITGGAGSQPKNIDEAIKLMEAQTARLEALAKLDALSPNASRWVADLRGSFRYIAIGGIVIATIVSVWGNMPEWSTLILLDLTGGSMSFIIGERMYLGIKK